MFSRPSKRNQITDVNEWIHFYKEYVFLNIFSEFGSLDEAIRARRIDMNAYNYIMNALSLKLINCDDSATYTTNNRIVLAFTYPAKFAKYFEDKTLITLLK